MARYRLRVHIRVMNRGQWDILDDLMFSDEVQDLIGDVSSYIDGRSLVIDKTVSYNGFLFVNPFYEIIDKIKYNVGECLAIGDYVNQGDRGMSAYVCDIGDFSESETDVRTKLSATSIYDMEAWVKARGKSTPQSVIATIKAFYGAEPQPTMQGPWSIEKEIELRHNVFSKADFDEIVEIAKANIARVYQIFGAGEQSNQLFISILTLAGQIGAAHGRKANSAEKKLYGSFIQGLPDNLLEVLVAGIEEPFDNDKLDAIKKLVDVAPQLCSSILDLSFCFIYVDGKVEANDKTNLQKLCGIFSMPMSAMYMAMQFGEEIPNPPIDYAAYVSGVDNDTVAYMDGSNGFINVNFGGQNTGIRMVSADLLDDDSSPINVNLNTSFAKTLDIVANGELFIPTYNLGKVENINGLYFGVPDQCSSLSELVTSSNVSKALSRSLKEKFLFLAVPSECEADAEAYQDLPISIHCKKSGFSENSSFLTSIWRKSESERKRELVDLNKRQLEANGFGGFPITYKSAEDNLAIVYSQIGRGNDDQFWCSYMVNVLYKSTSYSFMIYINAKKNESQFSKIVENWVSTISSKKTLIKKSVPGGTVSNDIKVELDNDEFERKILDLLKNGERYSAKKIRESDEVISTFSIQKINAVLQHMVQNGILIKETEYSENYYYSAKALYDRAVSEFDLAETVVKYEQLIKTFYLLGEYEDSKLYIVKSREQINEINYDEANKLMFGAKTDNDFNKAADAFKKLGNFRDSEANSKFCNEKKQELENSNAYDDAVEKMNDAKTSVEFAIAASLFDALEIYRDSKELAQKCKEKSIILKEEERKQTIYNQAIAKIASSDIAVLTQAATELDTISGWRDTDVQAHRIRTKISDLLIEEERALIEESKKKKKKKLIIFAVISFIVLGIILIILIQNIFIPKYKIEKAEEFLRNEDYSEAKKFYEEANGFGNSKERIDILNALEKIKCGKVEEGINELLLLKIPVEIAYDFSGGEIGESKSLMLDRTLSIENNHPIKKIKSLSNENNTFLYTSREEFGGLQSLNKKGYKFVKYNIAECKYEFDSGSSCVRLGLIAEWNIETYVIKYALEGGKVSGTNVSSYTIEDNSFDLIEPMRKGYTFEGWIGTDIDIPTKNVKIPNGSHGDKTYTAVWNANEYNVIFDSNQGICDIDSTSVLYDSNIIFPVPARDGYTFIGWYYESQKVEDGIWKYIEDITLTAEWKIIDYTITYQLNGGNNSSKNPAGFTVQDEIILSDPSKIGYTFLGWTFDGQSEPIQNVRIPSGTKENKTYKAHWCANTYHVTFNPNGGTSNIQTMDMVYDSYYTLPTPTKTGYEFLGWYNGSTKYESGVSKIFNDVELLAKWEAKSYTITYNANGGTISSTRQTVTYGKLYTVYTPSRPGYTFKGWYSNTNELVSGMWNKDSDISVTARWEIITYSIAYQNTYDVFNSNPVTYTVDEEIILDNLNLLGNPFVGWYTDSSCTTSISKIPKGTTGNIILYAKFTYAYEPIYNASDLMSIQMDKAYMLMNDIDLEGEEWTPFDSFKGVFNGNGFKIINFKITDINASHIGLFEANSGTIINLGVEGFEISGILDSSVYAGGLVGSNSGVISNCYANGKVTCSIARLGTTKPNYKTAYSGGLVGYNTGDVSNCYANCVVNSFDNWGFNDAYSGGLVAYNKGTIQNSYALGTVNAESISNSHTTTYAGGLIAENVGNVLNCYSSVKVDSTIEGGYSWDASYAGGLIAVASKGCVVNCYATGDISSSSGGGFDGNKAYAGGLIAFVGANVTVENCYATGDISVYGEVGYTKGYEYVGGLCANVNSSAVISNCYRLNTQTINHSNKSNLVLEKNENGMAKTIAEIQRKDFYVNVLGWSEDVWTLKDNVNPIIK